MATSESGSVRRDDVAPTGAYGIISSLDFPTAGAVGYMMTPATQAFGHLEPLCLRLCPSPPISGVHESDRKSDLLNQEGNKRAQEFRPRLFLRVGNRSDKQSLHPKYFTFRSSIAPDNGMVRARLFCRGSCRGEIAHHGEVSGAGTYESGIRRQPSHRPGAGLNSL